MWSNPDLDPNRVGIFDSVCEHLLLNLLHFTTQFLIGRLQLEVHVDYVVLPEASRLTNVHKMLIKVINDIVASGNGEAVGDLDHPGYVAKGSVVTLVWLRVEQSQVGIVAQELKNKRKTFMNTNMDKSCQDGTGGQRFTYQ